MVMITINALSVVDKIVAFEHNIFILFPRSVSSCTVVWLV